MAELLLALGIVAVGLALGWVIFTLGTRIK